SPREIEPVFLSHVSPFTSHVSRLRSHVSPLTSHVFVIYDDGFNYLTKMCLTNMRDAAFEMIAIAKSFGSTVIVSSSDSTDHYKDYLARGADFIIKGEAEITLLELMKKLTKGEDDFQNIRGLYFKLDEAIVE